VKDVTASSICGDVGIGPTKVDDVTVVFKSIVTRSSPAGLLPRGAVGKRRTGERLAGDNHRD